MSKLVYFTGDIALVDNLSIENCMAIQEPLKKLHEYEIAEEQKMLLKLPEEMRELDKKTLNLAFLKVINLCRYGVDVDNRLTTATELSRALHDAYMCGRQHEVDRMKVVEQEIRNKAIDEFVNTLKNSPNMHKWSCRDMPLEYCNGDDCDECENEFMGEIYQIAEQMKGELLCLK